MVARATPPEQATAESPLRPDSEALRDFWGVLVAPGDVHEVRMPKTRRGPARLFGTVSGYFDDGRAFRRSLESITGHDAEAVYVTLNPCNPELLARAVNRLENRAAATTADSDITKRRHLLIDVDPARPAGISATGVERDAAIAVRDAIRDYLTDVGCRTRSW